MLYDLGKSIQWAAQSYKKDTYKKPSLAANVYKRIIETFPKK
jgi:hypothetical protein